MGDKTQAFADDIIAVCRKHRIWIAQDNYLGAFVFVHQAPDKEKEGKGFTRPVGEFERWIREAEYRDWRMGDD